MIGKMAEELGKLRPATRADAALLAVLVNIAGEGLPLYLWEGMAAPGESAWDVGQRRAAREEGCFSYRNATIIERRGRPAGCLLGYVIPEDPAPIPGDMPAMFVPLQELENLASGTWYVNVLAVLPQFRGQGLGTRLLRHAEEIAGMLGRRGLSVIVSDANAGARCLYEHCGYRVTASRAMLKNGWRNAGRNWLLLNRST
ncbi:MAG: hypothetical protein NFCOHLIN_02698 [Gammaproteobacteria bacterium]|nr:hypothetical protein [Gammaproteobacteria bacterium]